LRVLEEGEFERVGGSRTVNVDVRLIAATNRNLAEAVANGTFRSDLYYRLSVFPITMPPLRERVDDIPMLVMHLVEQISSKLGKEVVTVPQSAMAVLQNYDWPGNVRELRNVIERAVIITRVQSCESSIVWTCCLSNRHHRQLSKRAWRTIRKLTQTRLSKMSTD
jgi:chemotaxis protein methyltransferase CheR